MGLSLGVKEGSRIKIGGRSEVRVNSLSAKVCKISVLTFDPKVKDSAECVNFDIVATERKEILPTVFCQLGKLDDHGSQSYARLVFEAPRAVQIDRVKGD